jgi:predicted negative regulator of RcsB-dependent stress response
MENKAIEQQKQASAKKGHWKRNFLLLLLIIILGAFGYGYYWYQGVIKIKNQSEAILGEYKDLQQKKGKYDQLVEAIFREQTRCKDFISQSAGDFAEFEHCKKFVEWANTILPDSKT